PNHPTVFSTPWRALLCRKSPSALGGAPASGRLIEPPGRLIELVKTRSLGTILPAVSVAIRPRLAADVSVRKLAGARGLVVNGPRQAGKSELLRMLQRRLGGTLLTLDEPQHLLLARADPTGVVQDPAQPLMID